jgi:hypothetical protein
MSPQSRDDPADDEPPGAREIVLNILLESDPARLIEVFYIAREPGFLETLRWLASLPDDARRQLNEFIGVGGKHDVHVVRPDWHNLVLTVTRR